MNPSSSDIIRYLTNSLTSEESRQFVDLIINDEEFAKQVLLVKSIYERSRDMEILNKTGLLMNYLNGEFEPEAEAGFEELLRKSSEWEFYEELIRANTRSRFSIGKDGMLKYSGNDGDFRKLADDINAADSEELSMLCNYDFKSRGISGIEAESPKNNELIFSDSVVFFFKTASVSVPKGWSVKIFTSSNIELKTLDIEGASITWTLEKPGKYYWKLIDPKGQMRSARCFFMVFLPDMNQT
ncbi:MAG: hypothetical protein NTX61_07300 [Bacteroidetes bacterium]|nr:hypothetical protein [Bacteroidota bacterium]